MCLVLTNPVEILAVQLVKQGIETGGFCTGHPSNYYLLLSNPYIQYHLSSVELDHIPITNM